MKRATSYLTGERKSRQGIPLEPWALATPVVFIVFNRPETTERVFNEIAKARPPKLLIVADGPRADRAGEAARCTAVRAITTRIDWPCDVFTDFSEVNLGCRLRVSSGLDWAFNIVEEAIILEDDCLPTPGFFRFCEELLEKYRNDECVAQIGGVNFQNGKTRTEDSYYFSRHPHIWGWATWRRAWRHFDFDMHAWPELRDRDWLRSVLDTPGEVRYWRNLFDKTARGDIDAWSYTWILACWIRGSLSIVPESNLISNIGFGPDATHTLTLGPLSAMTTREIEFPLRHPESVARNAKADKYTDRRNLTRSPVHQLVRWLKTLRLAHMSDGFKGLQLKQRVGSAIARKF